jgi:SDR family mycofactocin-dependent oxidoreductase
VSTRVALVTGAARGIGAATVRGLAVAGWAVVAVDRGSDDPRLPYAMGSRAELEAVVASALAASPWSEGSEQGSEQGSKQSASVPGGERIVARWADATDPEALGSVVAETEERFGGLDAVVAVAGVIAGGMPLWEMPADQLRAVLEVDLGGPINAARVGIPALLRRPTPRSGRFLAVASAAATRGLPMLSAYGAAKAGVAGLVRGLAVELADTGVTANAISPGSTATAMLAESARLYGLTDTHSFAAQQPFQRLLTPEEVAAALVWLAGTESGALTGAVIPVDGGLSL